VNKSIYKISKMDCSAEEQMVRMKLEDVDLEDKVDGFSFNCRLYSVDGELTGTPYQRGNTTR
jgi:hypothetical protein